MMARLSAALGPRSPAPGTLKFARLSVRKSEASLPRYRPVPLGGTTLAARGLRYVSLGYSGKAALLSVLEGS